MSSEKNKTISNHYSAKPTSQVPNNHAQNHIDLIIPIEYAGQRLDQALAKMLPDWSRSRLQTWVTEEKILLNTQPTTPKQKVWGSEHIRITPDHTSTHSEYTAEAIDINIIYEDPEILVINKPAGLVVHPGNGNWQGTLLNALLHHASSLSHIPRAGIVHRLDKETTGLLVVAKTIEAQTSLVRQLQKHTVKRTYLAIVHGQIKQSGQVDVPIGRHPINRVKMAVTEKGKWARTHYQPLEYLSGCTLIECRLETGRTHQIRVHMHKIGFPLVGDPTYGGKPKNVTPETKQLLTNFPRQALHAQKLELTHPLNQQIMSWETPIACDMADLIVKLKQI